MFVRLFLTASLFAAAVPAESWLQFRGPGGSGVAASPSLERPTLERHLIWKRPAPVGHSSPVVTESHIFLTAVEDEKLYTLALDRDTGRTLWRREAPRPRRQQLHENNNSASPTPASDGENVYVFFAEYGLLSYGPDGDERWRVPLGPFVNMRGMSVSPLFHDGRVLMVCDHDGGDSFALALDARTGDRLWRRERTEFRRTFATPAVVERPAGDDELVVPGSFTLVSYSVETGDELWRSGGQCWQPKAVPMTDGERVYINCQGAGTDARAGTYPDFADALARFDENGDRLLSIEEFYADRSGRFPDYDLSQDGLMDRAEWDYFRNRMSTRPGVFAVRLGGRGDVTESHAQWRQPRPMGNVPSPLLLDGVIYSIRNAGILSSIDAETGEILKQGRLPDALGTYFASPVAAGGLLYLLDTQGRLTVVRAQPQWEVLHTVSLGEGASATPAVVDGRIYIRGYRNLFCLGPKR